MGNIEIRQTEGDTKQMVTCLVCDLAVCDIAIARHDEVCIGSCFLTVCMPSCSTFEIHLCSNLQLASGGGQACNLVSTG